MPGFGLFLPTWMVHMIISAWLAMGRDIGPSQEIGMAETSVGECAGNAVRVRAYTVHTYLTWVAGQMSGDTGEKGSKTEKWRAGVRGEKG